MALKHSLRLRARGIIAASVLTVGVLSVILRVGYLSLYRGEELRYKAERRQLSDSVITAGRGTIYDSNMKVLAQSASTWLIYAVPSMINDDKDGGRTAEEKIELLVANFGEILGVDEDDMREKLKNHDSGYVKVAGQVEKEAKERIVDFRSEYDFQEVIGIDEDSKRYYPYNSFASSVIGFVNADGEGNGGVEQEYNDVLTGVEGRRITSKNGRNETIGTDYETVYEAQQGAGVVLTIDETIQYYLEEALSQAVIDHKAMNAYGIVMDVKTGAILAMSTMPGYDLNDPRTISNPRLIDMLLEDVDEEEAEEKTEEETKPSDEKEEATDEKTEATRVLTSQQQKKIRENENYLNALFAQWRNRVVSDTYEPGSVFKTYVLSAALEEGVVDENTTYTCVGGIQVADNYIKCWKAGGHGHETLAQGLMNSCNPFFITIGQRMGADLFYKYFEAFGFTEKTGIDLPGEVSPKAGVTYHTLEGLNLPELSSSSFGQTFQISPIQMITGISCIANGGYLMKPYVVAKTIDSEGNTITETKPTVRRQVISEKTSKQVASIMEEVVSHGTGKNAYVAGYRVAGKTGTSEKLTNDGQYIASFSGFAPADNPRIAVLVAIDEPKGEHGGGAIAAPVVGSIFEKTLVYLNVEAQYTDEELAKITKTAPSVVGKTVSAARNEVSAAGFSIKVVGDGETVVSQMPAPNSSLPADGVIVVYTEQDSAAQTMKVPDLTGMTISQANRAAVDYGFNIKIIGATYNNGEVVSYRQSLEAGSEAEIGTVITVYFKSSVNVVDG
ncbi:MAG: PASTA domain-containing protein [Ruminococcaceae bacterium]|jgi:stage V sporulation protein D (sporulation-specific penicillin-binding protein)|nr:PASTA domain-containing protein [Oscillospiraceae bacterium]